MPGWKGWPIEPRCRSYSNQLVQSQAKVLHDTTRCLLGRWLVLICLSSPRIVGLQCIWTSFPWNWVLSPLPGEAGSIVSTGSGWPLVFGGGVPAFDPCLLEITMTRSCKVSPPKLYYADTEKECKTSEDQPVGNETTCASGLPVAHAKQVLLFRVCTEYLIHSILAFISPYPAPTHWLSSCVSNGSLSLLIGYFEVYKSQTTLYFVCFARLPPLCLDPTHLNLTFSRPRLNMRVAILAELNWTQVGQGPQGCHSLDM
jgi:hypothetical protein